MSQAAGNELGPDHHADREGRGVRQGPGPRAWRRRLHHEAVLDARVSKPREGAEPLVAGDLAIDFAKRTVRLGGELVRTTFVEFEILTTLARHPGRVYSREQLLEQIWGDYAYRDPRTIDVHIRHLREKLERDAKEPEYLYTVRGVGYRFRDD
jgi:DNA-binding response OmpR family regulator